MPLARARQLERAGDWAAAATALEKAVARDPSEARLRLRLARACERQGRWEEAAQAYRAALALVEGRPRTFARLGRVSSRASRTTRSSRWHARRSTYWEHFRRPIDYSLLHHLFESLYYADVEFRDRCEPTFFTARTRLRASPAPCSSRTTGKGSTSSSTAASCTS